MPRQRELDEAARVLVEAGLVASMTDGSKLAYDVLEAAGAIKQEDELLRANTALHHMFAPVDENTYPADRELRLNGRRMALWRNGELSQPRFSVERTGTSGRLTAPWSDWVQLAQMVMRQEQERLANAGDPAEVEDDPTHRPYSRITGLRHRTRTRDNTVWIQGGRWPQQRERLDRITSALQMLNAGHIAERDRAGAMRNIRINAGEDNPIFNPETGFYRVEIADLTAPRGSSLETLPNVPDLLILNDEAQPSRARSEAMDRLAAEFGAVSIRPDVHNRFHIRRAVSLEECERRIRVDAATMELRRTAAQNGETDPLSGVVEPMFSETMDEAAPTLGDLSGVVRPSAIVLAESVRASPDYLLVIDRNRSLSERREAAQRLKTEFRLHDLRYRHDALSNRFRFRFGPEGGEWQ